MHQLKEMIPKDVLTGFKQLEYSLSESARNPRICGILDQTVLSAGKRFRPLLAFLVADLLDLDHESIAPYAIDIERIHAATLAHDDVVDGADTRRGVETLNKVASNKKAILAGDYLLAQVLQDVASRGDPRIVKELSRVIADLVEGEWLQIENSSKPDLTFADVEKVALKKTGSVIRWCCSAPFMIRQLDPELIALSESFGENLGIAFQLGDDLLDFKRQDGSEFADAESGVVSAVIFYLAAKDQDTIDATKIHFPSVPRDPDLLEEAMGKVRQQLDKRLTLATESFDKITSSLQNQPHSGQQTILAFQGLLQYLAKRI